MNGSMVINVAVRNSHAGWLGRINAKLTLEPAGDDTFLPRLLADKFPSWEVHQFPWTAQAVTPSGAGYTIATRDQTSIGDLTSGAKSLCTAYPPYPSHMQLNPMLCSG